MSLKPMQVARGLGSSAAHNSQHNPAHQRGPGGRPQQVVGGNDGSSKRLVRPNRKGLNRLHQLHSMRSRKFARLNSAKLKAKDTIEVGSQHPTQVSHEVGKPNKSLETSGAAVFLGPVAARITAMGDRVENKIEGSKFMKGLRRKATNVGHHTVDPLTQWLDKPLRKLIERADQWIEAHPPSAMELVDKATQKSTPQRAVRELDETADTMLEWANSEMASGTSKNRRRDVENAYGSAKVLKEITAHLTSEIANEDQELLATKGFQKEFNIKKKGLDIKGQFAHLGKMLTGGLTFAAKATKSFLTSIRRTSFRVVAGFGFGNYVVNAKPFAALHFPSLEKAHDKGSYADAMYLNYGMSVDSVVPFIGWSRRGKSAAGMNLVFFSAFYDDMRYGVWVGIPGVFGLSIGKDSERGSYVNVGASLPVPIAAPFVFAFPGGNATLYSPFLNPLEKAARPAAKLLATLPQKVIGGFRKVFIKNRDAQVTATQAA